ncbi:MAG: S8/S53 family peptidase [Candidatus Electryoneaceae bacterium]|nr:S8/S53 family peptidase [Candidatus Electryoneaceae bacterium]
MLPNLIFILALAVISVNPTDASPSSNILDATLTRDLFLIEQMNADPSPNNIKRMKALGLSQSDDPLLRIFLHFPRYPALLQAELERRNVKLFPHTWLPLVGAHKTGYLLAEARASVIRGLADDRLPQRISAAYRQLEPHNNLAAEETGANIAWENDPPLTGEDVRIVILDSGFNLGHFDLPIPTESMDYSDYPDTNDNVIDHISGHGTHVAGTAFGLGVRSNGQWRGMAPDADAIYFKIGNDTTGSASAAAVVGALRGAAEWADADILSMSYGGWDGFNDGSSVEEQALDWAVGEGVTVFVSAGNAAQKWNHYLGEVAPNDTTDLIQLYRMFAPDDSYWELYMIWYDGEDPDVHIDLTARIFDSDGVQIDYDQFEQVTSPRGAELVGYLPAEPLPNDSVAFFVEVINSSDTNQPFHLWIQAPHHRPAFIETNQNYSVLLPSTADSCISVGAFVSRTSWMDYLGDMHEDNVTRGSLAGFSSRGPRLDGVQKPNITGPGQRLISCRDDQNYLLDTPYDYLIIGNDGGEGLPADYIAMMGTSMSCPATAGTAALILQADPDLTPSSLRERIYRSARTDEFTGEVPNLLWGYGKIDVIRALSADDPSGQPIYPQTIEIEALYPNPSNGLFTLDYRTSTAGTVTFTLFDVSGRILWSGSQFTNGGNHRYAAFPVNVVASGTYFLKLTDVTGTVTIQAILQK